MNPSRNYGGAPRRMYFDTPPLERVAFGTVPVPSGITQKRQALPGAERNCRFHREPGRKQEAEGDPCP